ncbi:MAG: hypothetical protein Q9M43_04205 [Sulfurimonas sp.]|nr:hypothetical protein [Sulfurimonas sp.]
MLKNKKIIIFLLIIIAIVAMIPIIGNTLVKETLDKKLQNLESKGIKVTKSDEDVSYLETSRHYEFLLQDSEKFLHYLQKYSDKQLPPYTNALINGTLLGVDLKYSNIPFSKAVSLDIYPLALADELMQDIRVNDSEFSKYIEQFLFQKGLLYHIDYEIVSKVFSGYLKDVNENYTLKNHSQAVLTIKGTTFNGNGDLIAPSSLHVNSQKVHIEFFNLEEEMSIDLDTFSFSSSFENQTTYVSSSLLESLKINLKIKNKKTQNINISKIYMNISSNTQNEKAEINTKLSFENFDTQLKNLDINATDFNYDVAVSEMDKIEFEKLRILVSKAKSSNSVDINKEITDAVIDLLAKGLRLNVIDFSAKKIIINNENVNGFVISSELEVKEDKHLAGKMMFTPLLILGNIDFDFKSKISKKILEVLMANSPLSFSIDKYIKTTKDELELDVSYKQGSLKINGKTLLGR